MAHLTKGGVAKIASSVLRLCLEKPVLENYGMAVYIFLKNMQILISWFILYITAFLAI